MSDINETHPYRSIHDLSGLSSAPDAKSLLIACFVKALREAKIAPGSFEITPTGDTELSLHLTCAHDLKRFHESLSHQNRDPSLRLV